MSLKTHFAPTECAAATNSRDITNGERAEEALRESEQRFRTIFEHSGVGIFVVDMQGHPVKCNPLLLKMLGYSREELCAMTFGEFTHPADRDLDWELYGELIEGRRDHYQIEKRYLTKAGSVRWGRVTVSLVRDAAGRPSYSIRMVEDVTERKRAELMLAESRAELEALVECTDDFIWSVDARRFGLLTYNSALRDHFLANYQLAIAKGMTFADLLPPGQTELWRGFYQRVLTAGAYTMEYLTGVGSVPLLLSFNPLRRGGEIYGISVFGKNITKLKEAESALLRYQAQLSALASELSLAQERERRRIAFEIHDHVVQDLTLGKIMVGNSIRTRSTDKLAQVSGILDEAIRQMRSLIFDLSPPMLYEMGLAPALEALGERLGQEHGFSCNLLDGSTSPQLPEEILVGVFQSVRELFMNVVKHARARHVTLRLESEGGALRISLEDDGVGFEVENVFRRAQQQHSIGLFGVQQRLRHLGGSFEIESATGRGARLELTVPLTSPAVCKEVSP